VTVPRWTWRDTYRTHQGMRRSVNEDSCLARADLGLWAVADGMGGHAAGDFASKSIVAELDKVEKAADMYAAVDAAVEAIKRANLCIRAESLRQGGQTIGSTISVLLTFEGRCACIWAGDSRVYIFRNGALVRLSRDHNLAQKHVDDGLWSTEQAHGSPEANVLTRAVGGEDELDLEMGEIDIRESDLFLLCSDGITKELDDKTIRAHLESTPDLDQCADRLLEAALSEGGRDNITLVLVQFSAPA
jgi:protein phosphatase